MNTNSTLSTRTPTTGYPAGSRQKQSGFFDLGISLVILAMSGTAVYFAENAQATNAEVAVNVETVTIAKTDADTVSPVVASNDRNSSITQ